MSIVHFVNCGLLKTLLKLGYRENENTKCSSLVERIFIGSLKFRKPLYFQYVFVTELAVDKSKTIHEQLSKYLMTNLKPGADPAVVENLMKVGCVDLDQSLNSPHRH